MLGHKGKLKWQQKTKGLEITLPEKAPMQQIICLKIK